MKPEEKEIIEKINLNLKKMKDEINKVKYSGGKIKVGLKFGSAPQKIQTFNPPVRQVLAKFIERKTKISVPKRPLR